MNYYIQGEAAKAEQIKAAFEKLGYDVETWRFTTGVYYTLNGRIVNTNIGSNEHELILNNPDYKELPIGPMFKVGDWLYHNTLGVLPIIVEDYSELQDYKVVCRGTHYCLQKGVVEREYHLWTIADAKDGDVLVSPDGSIIIYAGKIADNGLLYDYVALNKYKILRPHEQISVSWLVQESVKPATKEQHDLLFAKMKEEGYEWDEKRKELRKTIKPTFKVGDWVVKKDGGTFYGGNYAEQITLIEVDEKGKRIWLSSTTYVHDDDIRLWTIQDANDGDVLSSIRGCQFIYDKYRNQRNDLLYYYAGIDGKGNFVMKCPEKMPFHFGPSTDAVPAAKEQRDLLFAKMREAGYEWDADKKELRKIRSHYDIANLHAGMPVLVRDYNNSQWSYVQFSHLIAERNVGEGGFKFNACGIPYIQCIPFEGNEHLLGTTDMCDEMYINW